MSEIKPTIRWRFPHVEGIAIRAGTGEWSEDAFFNDLLSHDQQLPETWYQAPPEDDVTDIDAWKRWLDFLQTRAEDASKILKYEALEHARARLAKLTGGDSEV